ncbi:MAG: hypothetical protein ACYS6W_02675 [Planctomycetota bacterium]|jgi:hypothetical protein
MEHTFQLGHGHPDAAPVFIVFFVAFITLVVLIGAAIKVLIFCKISSKAGYSWALGLLMLVPIADIILAFFLAFADWPVRKQLRLLKQQQNNTPG